MKKRDMIVYLFEDVFASFRSMKIEMVASIVLHIVILHSYCSLESMSPRLLKDSQNDKPVVAAHFSVVLWKKQPKEKTKTTTRHPVQRNIQKPKEKKKSTRKKQIPDPKRKKNQRRKSKERRTKERNQKKEPKKEVKEKNLKKHSRERLLRQLQSPNAHPNGVEGGTGEKKTVLQMNDNLQMALRGGKVDPILAKYVQDCLMLFFLIGPLHIKQTQLKVTVKVIVRR